MRTVAVLLAAGGGSRYRGATHKLLAPLHGAPVWRHALENMLGAGFEHAVVVTGASRLALPDQVVEANNPDWVSGQAGSLRAGIQAADALDADAVVVGLADQPFIPSSAWEAVRDAPAEHPIVIATYDGQPGPNPVRLGRALWPLLPAEGDLGARDVIRAHPEWVCRVACLGSVADIDTLEDLERWKSC